MLVVSDIHANTAALEAVLRDADGAWEGLLCLGDITGYGPDPEECVAAVTGLAGRTGTAFALTGNHDAALTGGVPLSWFGDHARASVLRTSLAVSSGAKAWLAGLSPSLEVPGDVSPLRTLAVHASPNELLTGYLFGGEETALALAAIEKQGFAACLCGHTHVAAVYRGDGLGEVEASIGLAGSSVSLRDGPVIVNPGSVGLPRFPNRGPDDPGYAESAWPARYGIWDTDAAVFSFREVSYDRRAATKRLLALGAHW